MSGSSPAEPPPDRRRLLVLGAGGWVGRAVADAARRRGWDVVRGVRTARPGTELVVFDRDGLADVVERTHPAAVVNCTGLVHGSDDEVAPVNLGVPAALAELSAFHGFRLVQLGSAAELGDPGTPDPVGEDHPLRPRTPYGRTKAAATEAVCAVADADAVVTRIFNVAGPAPVPGLLLADLVAKAEGDDPIVLRNAEHARDWITLGFVTDVLLAAAAAPAGGPRLVNVCSGMAVSHGELVAALARAAGRRVEIRSLGEPGIDVVLGRPARLERWLGRRERPDADALAAACRD